MVGMHAQLEAWLGRSIGSLSNRHLSMHLVRGRGLYALVLDAPLMDWPKDELIKIARIFPKVEVRLREVERMLLNQDLVHRHSSQSSPVSINRGSP